MVSPTVQCPIQSVGHWTDERIYVSAVIPYGELTHGVPDPRGERLAPGSLRTAPGRALRLYLAHGGDRGHYRIPRRAPLGSPPGARRARAVLRAAPHRRGPQGGGERRGLHHERQPRAVRHPRPHRGRRRAAVLDAILHGVALTPDPAYPSAKVTAIQTASERKAARLNAVAAMLEQGKAAALEARKYAPTPPPVPCSPSRTTPGSPSSTSTPPSSR